MGPATSYPKSTLRRFLPRDMSLPELFATSTFKHICIQNALQFWRHIYRKALQAHNTTN